MNWHLFAIAIFFYLTVHEIALFAGRDAQASASWVALTSTVFFLLLTWSEF